MRATVFGSRLVHCRRFLRRLFPNLGRPAPETVRTVLPGISVILRIGNDDPRLPGAMSALNSLDYPDDKLDIVFISEGAAGHTGDILQMTANPLRQIVVLRDPAGSAGTLSHGALNHAVSWAKHEILLFANTSTVFSANSLTQLAERFCDPAVGAVRGTSVMEAAQLREWLRMTDQAAMGTCALRRQCFLQFCEGSGSQPRAELPAASPAREPRFVGIFPKTTPFRLDTLTPSVLLR